MQDHEKIRTREAIGGTTGSHDTDEKRLEAQTADGASTRGGDSRVYDERDTELEKL